MTPKRSGISRREFARRAALASAAGTLVPVGSLLAGQAPAPSEAPQLPPDFPKLSPQSQAEVDARVGAILREYGERFSEAQKKDLWRLCYVIQPPLDRLRAYAIANADGPALYLKPLMEREKKPASPAAAAKKSGAAKKP